MTITDFIANVHYTLTMPPNPPAKTLWSAALYNITTRCLTAN